MLEFGCEFDDDLFGETKCRKKNILEPYCAQQHVPMWFLSDKTVTEDEYSISSITKYQGDWAFRNGHYSEAFEKYNLCISLVDNNCSLHRELLDNITRCHAHLERKDEALSYCDKAIAYAKNFEQKTVALKLQCMVYEKFNMLTEYLQCLYQLIILHPCDTASWLDLASLYERLTESCTSTDHHLDCACSRGHTVKCDCINSEKTKACKKLEINETKDTVKSTGINDRANLPSSSISEKCVKDCRNSKSQDDNLAMLLCCKSCGVLKQITCLYRTQLLLRGEYNAINSFVKDKNKVNQAKVMKLLEMKKKLLPETIESSCSECYQHVSHETYHNEEDIITVGDKYLLSLLEKPKEAFEQKWFSWIHCNKYLNDNT